MPGANRNANQMPDSHDLLHASLQLHCYLVARHLRDDRGLVGPDPGIRYNYRFWRFAKSMLRAFPWRDELYYTQAQGYWILANWKLHEISGETQYRQAAESAAHRLTQTQRADGAWVYPNPEWKDRIATTEGNWAALGLLQTYRATGEKRWLESAIRWYQFLDQVTGYQKSGDQWAINYFAYRRGARVCNNSLTTMRVLADLASTTGDPQYAEACPRLFDFLAHVQKPSGEFPYTVAGVEKGEGKPHFQCFQYNAFGCINLVEYYRLTGDRGVYDMAIRLAHFLETGQGADGHIFYECGNHHRAITYHAAAVGAALVSARSIGIDVDDRIIDRCYQYVLRRQRRNGSLPYSRREYHLLADRRSYPRYLAMILFHLLIGASAGQTVRPETIGEPEPTLA